MPLTKSGKKVLNKMKKEYGAKKASQSFMLQSIKAKKVLVSGTVRKSNPS